MSKFNIFRFVKSALGVNIRPATATLVAAILAGDKLGSLAAQQVLAGEVITALAKRILPFVVEVRTGLQRSAVQGQAALTELEDEVRRWTE